MAFQPGTATADTRLKNTGAWTAGIEGPGVFNLQSVIVLDAGNAALSRITLQDGGFVHRRLTGIDAGNDALPEFHIEIRAAGHSITWGLDSFFV